MLASVKNFCTYRTNDDEMFINRMNAGDETWVYDYDIDIKVNSPQWISKYLPTSKKISSGQIKTLKITKHARPV